MSFIQKTMSAMHYVYSSLPTRRVLLSTIYNCGKERLAEAAFPFIYPPIWPFSAVILTSLGLLEKYSPGAAKKVLIILLLLHTQRFLVSMYKGLSMPPSPPLHLPPYQPPPPPSLEPLTRPKPKPVKRDPLPYDTPPENISPFSKLPQDPQLHIIQYLDPSSMEALKPISKKWKPIVEKEEQKYAADFIKKQIFPLCEGLQDKYKKPKNIINIIHRVPPMFSYLVGDMAKRDIIYDVVAAQRPVLEALFSLPLSAFFPSEDSPLATDMRKIFQALDGEECNYPPFIICSIVGLYQKFNALNQKRFFTLLTPNLLVQCGIYCLEHKMKSEEAFEELDRRCQLEPSSIPTIRAILCRSLSDAFIAASFRENAPPTLLQIVVEPLSPGLIHEDSKPAPTEPASRGRENESGVI